jgi:protein tyrosine phosphatase
MIWEYKIQHIVILTKCLEAGRRKCEQYWADNIGDVFETQDKKMEITTTSSMPFADFEIRTFNAKNTTAPDEKPLALTQYHFTSWPDHGVPKFATSLISFIRRVQKAHNKEDGVPLLVHCSAGVGRTGTFMLLDSMLERIKAEKTVNVYEFLTGLRRRRVLMVQTLPQYVFIHDALCELITCGETDIAAPALKVKIQRLSKVIPGKGVTGFQEQFQLLDQVSRKPEEDDCSEAREHYNRSKNRYADRLPYNLSRARLRPTGEDGSEYINASFLDGYKKRNAYIATQGPLQNTVGDFWRLMWEFKSKVMVMLCSLTEDGHEACHPFWPYDEGGTAKYGKITVTLQTETSYDSFIQRKMLIQDDKAVQMGPGEGVVVTQFQLPDWPEHGRPVSTGAVVEMLDMITKAQMNTGNRAITILCNDGVGRTGTFICLHSQLERLKTEGVVDFFQAVKSARIQRAGLVPDADQYAYCHEVLADFVNSYDNYANFKDVV